MNHFESIGIPVADEATLDRALEAVGARAIVDVASAAPAQHLRWTDASGATLALHLDDGRAVTCITPFFVPPVPARWSVRTSRPHDDAGCAHCGGADCDVLDDAGELVTRATVQWLHYQPYRAWLAEPRTFGLQVVAFAHEAGFYDDEAAFLAGQHAWWPNLGQRAGPDGKPLRFASNAFLPEGMFGDGRDVSASAIAMFAGRVEASRVLENALTGRRFVHVRIATLPGAIDVVLTREEGAPAPGMLAVVRGWLVGRPETPPPEPDAPRATGWMRRLFGR